MFLYTNQFSQSLEIGKWERGVISVLNTNYSNNPFETEIDATFTHSTTGTELTLPDLDGVTGTLNCVSSELKGMLKRDETNPKKWKYTEGPYVVPIALRMEFFCEPASINEFEDAADFLEENNIRMLETRLTEELGQFENGRHDFILQGNWQNHQFDLTVWDRMQERMDALTERGLGAHIMFYSDDDGIRGWSGQSDTEELVIRYTITRLAGYKYSCRIIRN